MIYYLYNHYREYILYDINSKIRTEAIRCEKIKLTNISIFNQKKINKVKDFYPENKKQELIRFHSERENLRNISKNIK